MKKSIYFIFLAMVTIFAAGCASTKTADSGLNKVYVTNTTKVDLLPADAIKEELNLLQVFEGKFGDKEWPATFLSLQADSSSIQVLILNDMLIDIGSVVFDGKSCVMDSSFFPKQLKGEYIILDLQNVYADSDTLKHHYAKYGLEFKEYKTTIDGKYALCRDILKGSEVIEHIVFDDQDVSIQNYLRNYSYHLSLVRQE